MNYLSVFLIAIIALPIYTSSALSQGSSNVGTAYHAQGLAPGESGNEEFYAGRRCEVCVSGKGAEVHARSPHKAWTFHSGNCMLLENTGRNSWYLEYINRGSGRADISFEC